jgi:outer membrane protein assembly factor BamB
LPWRGASPWLPLPSGWPSFEDREARERRRSTCSARGPWWSARRPALGPIAWTSRAADGRAIRCRPARCARSGRCPWGCVDAAGTTYVVGTRGEVVAVTRDGRERWRASTDSPQPGPAALLSDDTLVFADALGEAVAVREGVVRWRTRFGRGDATHPAPLPLEDGGVVVATAHDLALLDSEGHERGRATLPEAATGPLVGAMGKVVAVGASGTVWAWPPGASEATRVGSFGSPVEGGATLADDHTLVAVTAGGAHLSALDLARGTASTRAVAPAGIWLGPPAMRYGTATLLLLAPSAELAVVVDASGVETSRSLLAVRAPPVAADGGVAPLVSILHTPPLVDSAGTVAFATSEGSLGVVWGATVELVADGCAASERDGRHDPRPDPSRAAGLAPLGPGAFVAACRSGSIVAVKGSPAGGSGAPHL